MILIGKGKSGNHSLGDAVSSRVMDLGMS